MVDDKMPTCFCCNISTQVCLMCAYLIELAAGRLTIFHAVYMTCQVWKQRGYN